MRDRSGVARDPADMGTTGGRGVDAPGRPARVVDADAACALSLLAAIEAEIIPRLMLAHGGRTAAPAAPLAADEPALADQVIALTDIVLHGAPGDAQVYVAARLDGGLALETLYLELLAPVARRLGAMWEADLCDFTQVTVGLWRLQQVVHAQGGAWRHGFARGNGRRALLIPAPGSQHTFGLLLVGEFFRRAGWQVHGDATVAVRDATAQLAAGWFDVVGLSIGSECHVGALTAAIVALRRASLNPSLVVLVGGPVAALQDDFVRQVGADASAPDAASAVELADRLVGERAGPS